MVTIDSGAAESVIAEDAAPSVPTRPSVGSKVGVQYVNANGASMPNRGEKVIPIQMGDGSSCSLRMQVTGRATDSIKRRAGLRHGA